MIVEGMVEHQQLENLQRLYCLVRFTWEDL